MGILIVIVAITATEDGIDTSLREFYVSGSRQYLGVGVFCILINLLQDVLGTDPVLETGRAKDIAAQVITAIDVIPDVWEACRDGAILCHLTTNIGLGMSLDISITRTGECVEHATVTQIDHRITGYRSLKTATIDKLRGCHILTLFIGILRPGLSCHRTTEIDRRTVG